MIIKGIEKYISVLSSVFTSDFRILQRSVVKNIVKMKRRHINVGNY